MQRIVVANLWEMVRIKKTTDEEVALCMRLNYEKRRLAKIKNVATKRYIENIVGDIGEALAQHDLYKFCQLVPRLGVRRQIRTRRGQEPYSLEEIA